VIDSARPSVVIRPACRPDVPPRVSRQLARRHTIVSDPAGHTARPVIDRDTWAAESSWLARTTRAARQVSVLGICTGGIGLLLYLALDKLGSFLVLPAAGLWSLGILAGGVASGLLASALSLPPTMTSAVGRWLMRRYRPAFVDASELDSDGRILLWRAQRAIDAALGSEVAGARMLDHLKAGLSLPASEWELATGLREISVLQAEIPQAARLGPQSAARAGEQRKILESVRAENASLVEALERYAAQVQEADQAFRDEQRRQREAAEDQQRALELSARDHRYTDLQAAAAAMPVAIDEVTSLTAEAEILARALRGSESPGESPGAGPHA
jgi:hypothetical protein